MPMMKMLETMEFKIAFSLPITVMDSSQHNPHSLGTLWSTWTAVNTTPQPGYFVVILDSSQYNLHSLGTLWSTWTAVNTTHTACILCGQPGPADT